CWLWIEKENLNTVDAAQRLAKFAGVGEREIYYGGLKDKNAITRQWFSLHLLSKPVDWSQWSDPHLRLLTITRHDRKLRRGTHRGNTFQLTLRNLQGDVDAFESRLQKIVSSGVPNYFGEQRFGREGRNIDNARRWIAAGMPRKQRDQISMLMSSLRSLLFNEVLAERVRDNTWSTALPGDVFMLDGSNSVFMQDPDAEIRERLQAGDIQVTGPLSGRSGKIPTGATVAKLEADVLNRYADDILALEKAGLTAERRSLRMLVPDLQWQNTDAGIWTLRFTLPRGCFATSLVRELALTTAPMTNTSGDEA